MVEDVDTKEITDMFSFYALPSSILGNDKHRTLHAAYCYYYFANKTPLAKLARHAPPATQHPPPATHHHAPAATYHVPAATYHVPRTTSRALR